MSTLEAIFLGILQGIIEFFPISSSGHLLAWQTLTHISQSSATCEEALFDAVVQVGSGLALFLYFSIQMFRGNLQFTNVLGLKKATFFIVVATLPAVVCGMLFHSYIKSSLYTLPIVAWSLMIGGILFILFDRKEAEKEGYIEPITLTTALTIGIAQVFALIPGVSRSGATIFTGRVLGLSRKEAVTFSFLLATPILIGAGSYDLFKTLYIKKVQGISLEPLLQGLFSSFISSLLLARPLLSLLGRVGLRPFGWYRIIIGGAILLYLAT